MPKPRETKTLASRWFVLQFDSHPIALGEVGGALEANEAEHLLSVATASGVVLQVADLASSPVREGSVQEKRCDIVR